MSNEKLAKIPVASLKRLPLYLSVLQTLNQSNEKYISSGKIAELANENASVVKKDLSFIISKEGKPKLGYEINGLILDIESVLKFQKVQKAIIVGVGKLGTALFHYQGFEKYNLQIVYGFDTDKSIVGTSFKGKEVFDISKINEKLNGSDIKIGIITTPAQFAQTTANLLVKNGIKAIWNFTSENLKLPENIVVKNENLATSLAILSKQLQSAYHKEEN